MRRTWRAFGRTILLYSRLSVLAFTISISSASYLPTAVVLFLSFLLITPVFFQRERQCERLVYSTEYWDQRRGGFPFSFFFLNVFFWMILGLPVFSIVIVIITWFKKNYFIKNIFNLNFF